MKTTISSVKNDYNYACDLYRFILSIGIMGVHVYWDDPALFGRSWWVYVEGFFLITGNLLAKHFDLENPKLAGLSIDECAKLSIAYVWNKVRRLLKYTVPVLLLRYLLQFLMLEEANSINFKRVVELVESFSIELFMLSSVTDGTEMLLGTLWYLSSMTIVLPLVCYLILRFRKAYVYIVSWLFAIIYILTDGIANQPWGIISLKRAFCFISLGVTSYYLGKCIVNYCSNNIRKIALTIIELLALSYVVFAVTFNYSRVGAYFVLVLFVGITIMMSACSYSSCLKGKFFRYLGELSVPIFVSQLFIGDSIQFVCRLLQKYLALEIGDRPRTVAYYVLTILFSVALKLVVDLYQTRIKSDGGSWRQRKIV